VTVDNVTVTVYIHAVAGEDPRYGIEELAELGGVSRRTVRFYIQEGVLPAPYGVGRGNHYGPEHLDALLRVRTQQEAGRTLDEIRRPSRPRERRVAAPAVEAWRRILVAPGVELHVSTDARLPNAAALRTLADWSRAHLGRGNENHDADE
jgi:DNA-binding transcriptional MerR regulator